LLYGLPEDVVADTQAALDELQKERKVPKIIIGTANPQTTQSTATGSGIGHHTDRQILRELISGEYCLQGVCVQSHLS
jgi:hypothetical protein